MTLESLARLFNGLLIWIDKCRHYPCLHLSCCMEFYWSLIQLHLTHNQRDCNLGRFAATCQGWCGHRNFFPTLGFPICVASHSLVAKWTVFHLPLSQPRAARSLSGCWSHSPYWVWDYVGKWIPSNTAFCFQISGGGNCIIVPLFSQIVPKGMNPTSISMM